MGHQPVDPERMAPGWRPLGPLSTLVDGFPASRAAATVLAGLLFLAVGLLHPLAGLGQTETSGANNTSNGSSPPRDVGEGVRGLSGGLLEAVVLVVVAAGLGSYVRRDRGDR